MMLRGNASCSDWLVGQTVRSRRGDRGLHLELGEVPSANIPSQRRDQKRSTRDWQMGVMVGTVVTAPSRGSALFASVPVSTYGGQVDAFDCALELERKRNALQIAA